MFRHRPLKSFRSRRLCDGQALDVLSLARAIGHKDLKMLMVYYRKSAEDLAKML